MWDDISYEDETEPPLERVLVAIVPRLEDWQVVLEQGWYRIPVQRAPKRIGASYIAFYHPRVFARTRWTVSYYAPVRRYEIVSRLDLFPNEPDHPRVNQSYYKIIIGPLIELPSPIRSKRLRRVTFIYTSLARLLQSREINELWLEPDRHEELGRALRVGEEEFEALEEEYREDADPLADQRPDWSIDERL